jgi:hypothetical protein
LPPISRDIDATLRLYMAFMDEIKERIALIEHIAGHTIPLPRLSVRPRVLAGRASFEVCQLQVRLICEALALACLTAHGEIPEVQGKDLRKAYEADKIMSRLEKLHPDFYPIRTHVTFSEEGPHVQGLRDRGIRKTALIAAYNDTGNYLHRGTMKRVDLGEVPPVDVEKVLAWNADLIDLLFSTHMIGRRGANQAIVCTMSASQNGGNAMCTFLNRAPEG